MNQLFSKLEKPNSKTLSFPKTKDNCQNAKWDNVDGVKSQSKEPSK
jgi:hypothetical protein